MLLGDMIAKATKAMGIQPCTPCQQRQAYLNALHARALGQQVPQPPAVQHVQPMQSFVMDASNGQFIARR